MKNAVIPFRALAVAFAAPMLFAVPAAAQSAERTITRIETPLPGVTVQLTQSHATRDHYRAPGYRGGPAYGYNDRQVRAMRRDAVQACRAAIRQEGRRLGYRDIDIDDDLRVRQTGPASFHVRFDEVEFESRRRDIERRVACDTFRGRVTNLSSLPHPARGGPPPRRW